MSDFDSAFLGLRWFVVIPRYSEESVVCLVVQQIPRAKKRALDNKFSSCWLFL